MLKLSKYFVFFIIAHAFSSTMEASTWSVLRQALAKCFGSLSELQAPVPMQTAPASLNNRSTKRRNAEPIHYSMRAFRTTDSASLLAVWKSHLEKIISQRLSLLKKEYGRELSDDTARAILKDVYETMFNDFYSSRLRRIEEASGKTVSMPTKISIVRLKSWNLILCRELPVEELYAAGIPRGTIGYNRLLRSLIDLRDKEVSGTIRSAHVIYALGQTMKGLEGIHFSTPFPEVIDINGRFRLIHPFLKFPQTMQHLVLDFSLMLNFLPPALGANEEDPLENLITDIDTNPSAIEAAIHNAFGNISRPQP